MISEMNSGVKGKDAPEKGGRGDIESIRPVICIVQARTSSTRLPGKVLKEILGRPMIEHLFERLSYSALIDRSVLATSSDASDDPLADWAAARGIGCYRGDLDDVLGRYYQSALKFGAKTVLRVTGDCPLIDPALLDKLITSFSTAGVDIAGLSRYPDGLDGEIFTLEALRRADGEARLASEREHVSPYMWKHPALFSHLSIESGDGLESMRWTVDDERDFELVCKVFEGLGGGGGIFHMDEIAGFLSSSPELLNINSGTERNEGYAKSLREDRVVK